MKIKGKRLVVVSNRLPVTIDKNDKNEWEILPGAGGLTTALSPVMEQNQGLWIGWPGPVRGERVQTLVETFSKKHTYNLQAVSLTQPEVDRYYHGFSNETIWPLFHDLLGRTNFDKINWETYIAVNRRFARAISESAKRGDIIWVQDYHLMLVAEFLKKMQIKQPLAFFLHIPFPSLDLFRRLPWKREIINALIQFDMIGFQTLRDRRNFVQCLKALIPEVGVFIKRRQTLILYKSRTIKVGNYPISIDFEEFNSLAQKKEVSDAAWYLHENMRKKTIILGLDRLDYTKGIPERFLAFERALEKYPELQEKVSLLQIVVPSRTMVPDYQNLKELLDTLIGRINGKYSKHGWIPIHYMFRFLDRVQLLGHYKACEIALVTPLRDGMNLVAKEYCASSIDCKGVLILSEFAGAAAELSGGALIVNPYDVEGTADAIYTAFNMDQKERAGRMRLLRTRIKRNNVYRWVDKFLASFSGEDPLREGELEELEPHGREVPDMNIWIKQTQVAEEKEEGKEFSSSPSN
ncbi:MAG: trehalose-6-phosphate synthase [Candidatus Theseobacter exili]|nr:trehalose-6-phosphate synthase [Candidatus Theseobacter exili]